jgi:predicted ATP-dependent serine protease
MMDLKVCDGCGVEWSPLGAGRCTACGHEGAREEIVMRPRYVATMRAKAREKKRAAEQGGSLEHVKRIETVACDATIAHVFGGRIMRKSVIQISGAPGAGKSTCAAELAHKLGGAVAYMDAEASDALVLECLMRGGFTEAEARDPGRVRRIIPNPKLRVPDWRVKISSPYVIAANVVIVDSQHEWARTDAERGEMTMRLRELADAGRVVMMIAHWSRKGRAKGATEADHRVDAIVYLEESRAYSPGKCRWTRPREIPRSMSVELPTG